MSVLKCEPTHALVDSDVGSVNDTVCNIDMNHICLVAAVLAQ